MGGGLSLGASRSTNGSQNGAVPAGIDAAACAGVPIGCERFAAGFGLARWMPGRHRWRRTGWLAKATIW